MIVWLCGLGGEWSVSSMRTDMRVLFMYEERCREMSSIAYGRVEETNSMFKCTRLNLLRYFINWDRWAKV